MLIMSIGDAGHFWFKDLTEKEAAFSFFLRPAAQTSARVYPLTRARRARFHSHATARVLLSASILYTSGDERARSTDTCMSLNGRGQAPLRRDKREKYILVLGNGSIKVIYHPKIAPH
jgi:hypothetical protein